MKKSTRLNTGGATGVVQPLARIAAGEPSSPSPQSPDAARPAPANLSSAGPLSLLEGLPQQVLIGVSGGVDSVSLLHALVQSGRRPIILHFNHGWREESGEDAVWMRGLARHYQLRFILGKETLSKDPIRRSEEKAREVRYRFFARAARLLGCHHLVLAHQANDQVETFLLQLVRGSGSAGGMAPISFRRSLGLHTYRPWLPLWRREIEHYAQAQRLCWRTDSTNGDLRLRRNAVRCLLLPQMEKVFGPAVLPNLWRNAEIRREELHWMEELCSPLARQAQLSVRELRILVPGQQRRTLWQWLSLHGVVGLRYATIETVRKLLSQTRPAKVNLTRGRFVRRRAGLLFLE